MLNLIVFIGDKAQVNYMDGYTIKLSLCEKDVCREMSHHKMYDR